jgi:carbonic anhydrase
MLTFSDESIRQDLRSKRRVDADAVAFLPFKDLDGSIHDDIAAYKASALVRTDIPIRGFIYDFKTGRLREVESR